MTLDNVASRAPCHKLHATVCSAGRSNLGTRTILVARGSLVRSSSPSIVRRRSRRSLPRLHLRQGFLYATFCLPLPDYRISSARLFRRRRVYEHPHLRARCLPNVQKDAPRKSGYRHSLGRRANRIAQQVARPINLIRLIIVGRASRVLDFVSCRSAADG